MTPGGIDRIAEAACLSARYNDVYNANEAYIEIEQTMCAILKIILIIILLFICATLLRQQVLQLNNCVCSLIYGTLYA